MNHIRLYDLFRIELHLSDDKAADFVMAVEEATGSAFDANKELIATKNDIHLLEQSIKSDMSSLDQSIRKDIRDIDQSLRKDILSLGQSIRKDITSSDQLIRKDLHGVDQSIRKDFYSLEQLIRKEIQQSKEDTYKAIFLAGFAQFIAILGSVHAIIKFMK
jgi:hypothetical protein